MLLTFLSGRLNKQFPVAKQVNFPFEVANPRRCVMNQLGPTYSLLCDENLALDGYGCADHQRMDPTGGG